MALILKCVKGEFNKLLSRKSFVVFIILLIMVYVVRLTVTIFGSAFTGVSFISDEAMYLNYFYTRIFLPFIIILAVGNLFASEYYDKSIRAMLYRPVSRVKLYAAKSIAVFLLACVYSIVMIVMASASSFILGTGIKGMQYAFLAYALDLIPVTCIIMMSVLINQLIRNPGLAALLSIAVYIGIWALGTFVSQLNGMMFTGYLQWHNLWLGKALPIPTLIMRMLLLAGYVGTFGCAGYMVFERMEF